MSTKEPTRTITPEIRRELLAAWDATRWIVDHPPLWVTYPTTTRRWFELTIEAYGEALSGPLSVAGGC